ncbi:MAG: DUF86 domain-containing protein [Caldilineaceae bacterium]|nr:DUF86 domain-containing protein [Caldilineaceae bacterium]
MDDVILNKTASIQRCLKRIRTVYTREAPLAFADDFDTQDIVVLNLMRAAEQAVDLANYLVRKQQLGVPQNSKESFLLLGQAGVINVDLAEQLGRMVGFRNIAVHEYQRLELAKVVDIVENHLIDFQRFTQQILGQQELL